MLQKWRKLGTRRDSKEEAESNGFDSKKGSFHGRRRTAEDIFKIGKVIQPKFTLPTIDDDITKSAIQSQVSQILGALIP